MSNNRVNMKVNYVLLILVLIQVGIIMLGGFIFTMIPGEFEERASDYSICLDLVENNTLNLTRIPTPERSAVSFSDSVFFIITTITTIGIFISDYFNKIDT